MTREPTTIVHESTTGEALESGSNVLDVKYDLFLNPRNVLLLTLIGLSIYYMVGFGLDLEAFQTDGISTIDLLIYMLVDQFLIECVSVWILFTSIVLYAQGFGIGRVRLTAGGMFRYFLAFLPLALVVFFVINPVTQTLRYLLRFSGEFDLSTYLDVYLLNSGLYLTYTGVLIPLMMVGLGVNLLIQIRKGFDSVVVDRHETSGMQPVYVTVDGHETVISSLDVQWFEVKERTYYAVTREGIFRIRETLSDLEDRLDPERFMRVSRSVIVNLDAVESYAHWKNGKYVVRMSDTGHTEHSVPRGRVREFKKRMLQRRLTGD